MSSKWQTTWMNDCVWSPWKQNFEYLPTTHDFALYSNGRRHVGLNCVDEDIDHDEDEWMNEWMNEWTNEWMNK